MNAAHARAPRCRQRTRVRRYDTYVEGIRHIDTFIARLHTVLAAAGRTEANTVFVVVGDHGRAFGEHGRHHHGTAEACPACAASRSMACMMAREFACATCASCLGTDVHETSIHVPMFVWGAGVPVADVHGLRSLVDVKPTMLELLGLPLSTPQTVPFALARI